MSSARTIAAAHDAFLSAQLAGLPALPAVEKLSDTVWRILGGNPGKVSMRARSYPATHPPARY